MVHTAVNAALGAALFAASIAEGSAFVPSSGRLPVASKAASLSAARVGAHPASWNRRLRATNLNMVAAQPKEEKTGLGWDSHVAVDQAPDTLCRAGTANTEMRSRFEQMCRKAQLHITSSVEKVDGKGKFQADSWVREGGGGGISMVMKDGDVWEKAGCSLSVVYGSMPQEALAAANDRLKFGATDRAKGYKPGEKVPFFACGLSSVMHPKNPHCPTMHFNYRYFETEGGVSWFGGGTDITPSYVNEDDMKHFHGTLKTICDKHDKEYYPKYKAWADEYFWIKHRGETRGLGGIFFDDKLDKSLDECFAFSEELAMGVTEAYLPIIEKHKNDPWSRKEKEWQQMRRGRYVEFNLVYDRGTIFGLKTGGRIESILMSLPETSRWEYCHEVVPGSPEEKALKAFQNPSGNNWV